MGNGHSKSGRRVDQIDINRIVLFRGTGRLRLRYSAEGISCEHITIYIYILRIS